MSKAYRGQRKNKELLKHPCGCYHCTGTTKEELDKIKLKSLTKEEVEEQRRSAYEYKF